MALRLLFADQSGQVFDHPELLALALDDSAPGRASFPLGKPTALPSHASLAVLPGRRPLGYNPLSGAVEELKEVKLGKRSLRPLAVGAVLPPGWTRTAIPAYRKSAIAPLLPQWAYTAAAWDEELGGHVTWAVHTDKRNHWSPADHSTPELPALVAARLAREPGNPLLQQLARCALEWRCFTAQNTFYVRDEGAIPASSGCNARCVGCISEQPEDGPPASHERMERSPEAAMMAGIGIAHLTAAPGRTMVSFGQGCEGEPLTQWKRIEGSIRQMRGATRRGSINLNTNGSLPKALSKLIDAGLDACRVSLNSASKDLYEAYYQPIGYGWEEVEESIRLAKRRGIYTALNLLTFPGVTDREGESDALCRIVSSARVDQVQVRSLAIDPDQYLEVARGRGGCGPAVGIEELIRRLKRARRGLVVGNFARGLAERRQ